jgi:hypothetical protein
MPDAQVAARIGRTKKAVYLKRREVGRAKYLPPGCPDWRWRKEEVALLGTAPDEEIARHIGRTRRSVYQKRWAMGIASPFDGRRRDGKR